MTSKAKKLVGEICLYGTRETGAGWLVRLADGKMLGDGEPVAWRTFSDAIYQACAAVMDAGIKAGTVRIFEPRGQLMAEADLNHPGYFGEQKWQIAPVFVIDVQQITAVAILAAAAKGD